MKRIKKMSVAFVFVNTYSIIKVYSFSICANQSGIFLFMVSVKMCVHLNSPKDMQTHAELHTVLRVL